MKILLAFLVSAVFLVSCSVEKTVQKRQQLLTKQYQDLPDYESLPQRTLLWRQAWHLAEQKNLALKEAERALQQAQYEEKRIFYEFVPLVDFGKYYNMSLFHSNERNAGINEFSFNVIFNIPSLVNLPVRKYTAALAVFKAEKDVELKKRELQAKLYKVFREAEMLAEQRQRVTTLPPEQRRQQYEKTEPLQRALWLELSTLLNDYSARWNPVTMEMPRVSVNDYRARTKTPAELTVVQMALTAEAARLRKLGVAMQSWPQVNIDFFSPSLFSSSGGHMGGLMNGAKDTRMSLNFYLSLDTQGRLWHERQVAEAEYRAVLEELQQNMWQHKEKMAALLKSWEQYNTWRQAMTAYSRFRENQGAATPEELAKRYAEQREMKEEFAAQEKQNIERECALLQEYGFPAAAP